MRQPIPLAAAAMAMAAPLPAMAAPITQCANRNAPFSIALPLYDTLASGPAQAVIEKNKPGLLRPLMPMFNGGALPSFATILTTGMALRSAGASDAEILRIDADLKALPVSSFDKAARCARFDTVVPVFKLDSGKRHLLLFEKINGFKDGPSVQAAHLAFVRMAERLGWQIVSTENGGAFNPETLRHFDAVVWNNNSGEVLTISQRKAFRDWLERGGGFVGVHGAAGDPAYFWNWYPDKLIGARFAGHPGKPQFQEARILVDKRHPLAGGLPAEWTMTDEWYSFKSNPRRTGARVILTIDESSYTRSGDGQMLDMGADHPLAWTNCLRKGRVFYSAIGHLPQAYAQPEYVTLLETALAWAANRYAACH